MKCKSKHRITAMAMAVVMAATVLGSTGPANTTYAAEKTVTFPDKYTQDLVQPIEDDAVVEKKVEALIKTMTVDEKFTFLGGSGTGQEGNAGDLPGVARLGVPRIKMYDGPAGLLFTEDTTNPPQEQMLAATWSEEMAELYGKMYSQENLAMGGTMMLSAQFDIQRHPFWSRTKDQMGEDAFLLSSLSDDMTKGMQSEGGIAVLKHYAVASDDGDLMMKNNQNVDEQTLHELYLPGFETAIKNGGALGVMTAYNRTNGERSSQNHYLLLDVLREMWGYEYFTITDWGGNHTFTLNDGTDIEMPSLNHNRKAQADQLVKDGRYTQAAMDELIDNAVRHILNAYGKSGYLTLVQVDEATGLALEDPSKRLTADMSPKDVWIDVVADSKGLSALHEDSDAKVQKVAEEGAVLLKNDISGKDAEAALPIKKGETAAVIGTNGMILLPGTGGERSYGTVASMTSPYEALADLLGENNVEGEIYKDVMGEIIPTENLYTSLDGNMHGANRTYGTGKSAESGDVYQGQFHSNSVPEQAMEGYAIGEFARVDEEIDFNTNTKTYVNGTGGNAFDYEDRPAYTWETYIEAPESGKFEIVLQSIGAQAAMSVYDITLKDADPDENGKYNYNKDNIGGQVRKGSASGASVNQGTQWYNNSTFPSETGENLSTVTLNMTKGKRYRVGIASANTLDGKDMQVGLSWIKPSDREANLDNAIQAAKDNDKVVVFAYAGTSSLGASAAATSLKLPEEQQEMIRDIAAAAHANGNKVIVVLQNSAAVVMEDWINQVDAILDIYYPGQRGGVATANLLTGKVNPSGKLAFTIPKKNSDTFLTCSEEAFNSYRVERAEGDYKDEDDGLPKGEDFRPPFGGGGDAEQWPYEPDYPSSGGSGWGGGMPGGSNNATYDMNYTEGIFTGYRWYDKEGVTPQYDFGYGLSYTTFKYSNMKVNKKAEEGENIGYDVTFTLTNTGDVTGSEVAQIYLGAAEVPDGVQMAKYQLAGYQKVKDIEPGESREVTIHVSERSLSYWNAEQKTLNEREDGTKDKWTVAEGERVFYVGAASDDFRQIKTVNVGEATDDDKLAEAENKLDQADASLKDAIADKEQADASLKDAEKEAEEAKKEAEEAKKKAEEAKKEAEEAKKEAEKQAEEARKEAEEALKQAEEAKKATEEALKSAEAIKKAADEALKAAEAAKKKAEDDYKALQQQISNQGSQVTVGKVNQKKPTSKKKGKINVSWNAEKGASGYEVQYSLKSNMKNAVTKTVKGSKTKLTLKKLKSKKKYYIRVRAYKKVGSMTVYGAYSKKLKVKAK